MITELTQSHKPAVLKLCNSKLYEPENDIWLERQRLEFESWSKQKFSLKWTTQDLPESYSKKLNFYVYVVYTWKEMCLCRLDLEGN